MSGFTWLRRALVVTLVPAVLVPPGARAATPEVKPVWTFVTTTAGTLNFTNYAFATKGQANGKKYEISLQCRRYHGDKAEQITLGFSGDLANGKPFKIDRLAYRRDLEKAPSYIHQPMLLAEDPLFPVRTYAYPTAFAISSGRYLADKKDPLKKAWSETSREWTASGGSEKPASAIFDSGGQFREDPLWIAMVYSIGADKTASLGGESGLVWEAKIDLTGLRTHAETLVKLCGLMD
jgi:hypothetical protein